MERPAQDQKVVRYVLIPARDAITEPGKSSGRSRPTGSVRESGGHASLEPSRERIAFGGKAALFGRIQRLIG